MRMDKQRPEIDPNSSVWKGDQPSRNPRLDRDLTVDVAVIGAGFTGLSSAYHLKQRFPNKHIIVLEARGAGHGASGRNGGMLLTSPLSEYMTISRPELHKKLYDVGAANIERIVGLMGSFGLGDGIRRDGSLVVNTSRRKAQHASDYVEKARSLGLPLEYWPKDRVVQELGTVVYWGGIYDPTAGEINPMKLVLTLKKAAEGAGVAIYEESPVIRLKSGPVMELEVGGEGESSHEVTATAVVVGTNGYTPHLGLLDNKVMAVHTEMAATPPLDDSLFEQIGWKSRITFHDDRQQLFHLGTPDNRITIGAGNTEYQFNNGIRYEKDIDGRRRALTDELVRIYPKLEGIQFEMVWSGIMGVSLRLLESIGVTGAHQNIYYGMGYAGHGVNMATLAGRIIADLYAGEGDEWKKLPYVNRPLPNIPPEPFKWLGYKTIAGFMRIQDFINAR